MGLCLFRMSGLGYVYILGSGLESVSTLVCCLRSVVTLGFDKESVVIFGSGWWSVVNYLGSVHIGLVVCIYFGICTCYWNLYLFCLGPVLI